MRIASYHADYVIDARGRACRSPRRSSPCFPDYPARHGIFQFFDIADSYDGSARLIPYDITVTRDGRPEPVTLSWDRDRYRVVADRLGRPVRRTG